MRFFYNNLRLAFSLKSVLTLFACIGVSLIFAWERFPQLLLGVKGGFQLYTAIPWIAAVFPFFFFTGSYYAAQEENMRLVLIRLRSLKWYFACTWLAVALSAVIYCMMLSGIALMMGGRVMDALTCFAALSVNLTFIASVQYAVYLIKKSVAVSVGVTLGIILCALLFAGEVNVGAWGMVCRSSIMVPDGFELMIVAMIQIILTVITCAVTVTIKGKSIIRE